METISVNVKGYTIYCENDQHELYDFFVPKEAYRLNKQEAQSYVPETHQLIDVKRDTKSYLVKHDDLLSIKL